MNDLPKIAGKLYSANLTRSTTHGVMVQYSDAELLYLLNKNADVASANAKV